MDGLRDSGRRRLVVATAGIGVLAAAAASAVGATRPPPHHDPPVTRSELQSVGQGSAGGAGAPSTAGAQPPDAASSGS